MNRVTIAVLSKVTLASSWKKGEIQPMEINRIELELNEKLLNHIINETVHKIQYHEMKTYNKPNYLLFSLDWYKEMFIHDKLCGLDRGRYPIHAIDLKNNTFMGIPFLVVPSVFCVEVVGDNQETFLSHEYRKQGKE